jgi:molybdopterin/thiamine biosynthesis adenylyltransferase
MWSALHARYFDTGPRAPELALPTDLGRVLQVGAGAVGCALDYWLAFLGVAGHWTVVDGDVVEVSNLNRQLLFVAVDTAFPAGFARKKSDVCTSPPAVRSSM